LISKSESEVTYDIKKYYIILNHDEKLINHYITKFKAKKVNKNFSYDSKDNNKYLTIKEIKKLIEVNDLGL
jgi:FlaA1/EpsC-like NDP-sugar epimerase